MTFLAEIFGSSTGGNINVIVNTAYAFSLFIGWCLSQTGSNYIYILSSLSIISIVLLPFLSSKPKKIMIEKQIQIKEIHVQV